MFPLFLIHLDHKKEIVSDAYNKKYMKVKTTFDP